MAQRRLTDHPILTIPPRDDLSFKFNGLEMAAQRGEVISSALFANGVHTFGHHPKDNAPQGIFCANGQCAQCTVLADGLAVKACMTKVRSGMDVRSLEGLPELPELAESLVGHAPELVETEVLIIGGGPAGLSAATELGQRGVNALIVDDKDRLGGKLLLQTHKFFGSIEDCRAGTRGMDIGRALEEEAAALDSATVWLESTAVYVYGDGLVGVVRGQSEYALVKPQVILVATGAREKSLIFPGNTLPGVYGAGAFQTLVNRDLVVPAERLFVVGGGNVGLIAAYHALQAGIEVVGLVEALPACGGYKVHEDKIRRLGVPVHTSRTVLSANGTDHLESVTTAAVDDKFRPIAGTEQTHDCDTLLIAVGLNPVDEFILQAEQAGIKVFAAGDAKEIAEASSAMFNGKIAGVEIARELGREKEPIPEEWRTKAKLLKSHPGPATPPDYDGYPEAGVTPIFHCTQDIPCNPCTSVCDHNVIRIEGDPLLNKPRPVNDDCIGCLKCLMICPGLAVTLVDYRKDEANPTVSLAYEVYNQVMAKGDEVRLTDYEGRPLGQAVIERTILTKASNRTQVIQVKAPKAVAKQIAGFRIIPDELGAPKDQIDMSGLPDEAIVCRCERVTAGEVRALIAEGVTDLNQIKAITRAGMGACGFKTCQSLIMQLMRAEGIAPEEITPNTVRPLFVETPLGVLGNIAKGGRS